MATQPCAFVLFDKLMASSSSIKTFFMVVV
jgi:hypothetical protein